MKEHTSKFKETIKEMGREHTSLLIYNERILREELFSVSIIYETNLLKSAMKQLEIESSIDIPLGTIVNYQLGIKVNDDYEFLDYGNYVVYSSEKQEDMKTFKIVCFDKMLYSMKDYEELDITYPTTIRDYIQAICNKLNIDFYNGTRIFANYNKIITRDLYVGLGYTYRDVLDELAQVTGSTICINKNDELEIRYIAKNNVDSIDEEFLKDINVTFGEKYRTSKCNSIK